MGNINFIPEKMDDDTDWADYIGMPIVAQTNGLGVKGVVKSYDPKKGVVYFRPSQVMYDGERMRLEDKVSAKLVLAPGTPIVIKPLRDGDLEEEVRVHNLRVEKEKDAASGAIAK